MVDADAEGDDDPTQPFVKVDGLDPLVSDPWRTLEAPACAVDTVVPAERTNSAPRDGNAPAGDSPSNPTGASRTIQFGVTSIYEFDAEYPIGVHVEDSPTPVVIPGRGELGHGGGPVPAGLHTPSRAEGLGEPTVMEDTLGSSNRTIPPGPHPNSTGNPPPPLGVTSRAPLLTPRGNQ